MARRLQKIFSPKQLYAYANSNNRYNLYDGSVRSGKTHISFWRWAKFVRSEAPKLGELYMIGKTERTLERNVINPMIGIFGARRMSYSRGSGTGLLFGRRFYAIGANDERSLTKIQGSTMAGAYGDEIALWPESFFRMMMSRLSVAGAKFFGTTNPDGVFHWLKTSIIDRRDELDISYIRFLLEENTFLPPEYVENLKKEYTGLWHRRFILGLWCAAEGAIYDMWDEARHVKPTAEAAKDCRLVDQCVAVDYGTANPTAALLVQAYRQQTKKLHLHVAAEYYYSGRDSHRQKTDAQYIKDFKTFYARRDLAQSEVPLIIDPSASSLKAAAREQGFKVRDANNAVLDGIRIVGARLGADELTVAPECINLRREISSYAWDTKAQERGEDKPKKENDHACDALRYGVKRLYKEKHGPVRKPTGW